MYNYDYCEVLVFHYSSTGVNGGVHNTCMLFVTKDIFTLFCPIIQSLGFDLLPPSPKKPLPILASGDQAERQHPLPVNLSLRTDEGN